MTGDDLPCGRAVFHTTFLSGPASVFGVPGRDAAEMMIAEINNNGGIGGVPLSASFIDEGAGGEALLSEYRRLVEQEGADAMFAAVSSGNCTKLAPLAEDLKVLNILWDCGTQTIFEENDYSYNFRTQGNATSEMMAAVLYVVKNLPDAETIAVVNQDYAWGRDSWAIFSAALAKFRPDIKVVAEFFPKFGAPDFSTEVSRLQALEDAARLGRDQDFLFAAGRGADDVSSFRLAPERGSPRDAEHIHPAEIALAAAEVIASQIALPADELLREISRVLGYSRTSARMLRYLQAGVDLLAARGGCIIDEDSVRLPRDEDAS